MYSELRKGYVEKQDNNAETKDCSQILNNQYFYNIIGFLYKTSCGTF